MEEHEGYTLCDLVRRVKAFGADQDVGHFLHQPRLGFGSERSFRDYDVDHGHSEVSFFKSVPLIVSLRPGSIDVPLALGPVRLREDGE
jgi:hypothetical protein